MQVVSIDMFSVPPEAEAQFRKESELVRSIVRKIPGFVEGFFHEKTDGDSEYNFITTAVWESEEAFTDAGKAIREGFQKAGFNPHEAHGKLGVKRMRSEYKRVPY